MAGDKRRFLRALAKDICDVSVILAEYELARATELRNEEEERKTKASERIEDSTQKGQ